MRVAPIEMAASDVALLLSVEKREHRIVVNPPAAIAGDLLWVKEPWYPAIALRAFYEASHDTLLREDGWKGDWIPAAFMQRHQSRISLHVVSLRPDVSSTENAWILTFEPILENIDTVLEKRRSAS